MTLPLQFTFLIVVQLLQLIIGVPLGKNVVVAPSDAGGIGLIHALQQVQPGDRLILPKGVYPGPFYAVANGTEENAIEIVKAENTTLALLLGNGKSPALTVSGNNWKLTGFNISNEFSTGLTVTGNNFQGDRLNISKSITGLISKSKNSTFINSTVNSSENGVIVDTPGELNIKNTTIISKNCTRFLTDLQIEHNNKFGCVVSTTQ